jgi:NAD(P)-dependent dehydrogenase (short-subunit alcohol dehydrogenase family)
MESNMELLEKVAIVTGGGSGIGRAISLKFAKEGADIAIVYSRNDSNAQETARMIGELGRTPKVLKADISNKQYVADAVENTLEEFGHIDVLVNNAAVSLGGGLLDLEEHEWDRTLDVNLKGAFLLSQAVAREMVRAQIKGKIVNIGSVHGQRAWQGDCCYSVAKAGLIQLTRSMALDLAQYGICVNLVSPGAIAAGPNEARTPDPDFMDRVMREVPLGRMGEAEEVADLVLFLAAQRSDYVTGAEFVIDGGLLLHPFTV